MILTSMLGKHYYLCFSICDMNLAFVVCFDICGCGMNFLNEPCITRNQHDI